MFKSSSGSRDSVHVLVHVRLRHYCHPVRHPAKLNRRAGLSFCVRYANLCVNLQLAVTYRGLDSKSVDPCGHRDSTPPPGTNLRPANPINYAVLFPSFHFAPFLPLEGWCMLVVVTPATSCELRWSTSRPLRSGSGSDCRSVLACAPRKSRMRLVL